MTPSVSNQALFNRSTDKLSERNGLLYDIADILSEEKIPVTIREANDGSYTVVADVGGKAPWNTLGLFVDTDILQHGGLDTLVAMVQAVQSYQPANARWGLSLVARHQIAARKTPTFADYCQQDGLPAFGIYAEPTQMRVAHAVHIPLPPAAPTERADWSIAFPQDPVVAALRSRGELYDRLGRLCNDSYVALLCTAANDLNRAGVPTVRFGIGSYAPVAPSGALRHDAIARYTAAIHAFVR